MTAYEAVERMTRVRSAFDKFGRLRGAHVTKAIVVALNENRNHSPLYKEPMSEEDINELFQTISMVLLNEGQRLEKALQVTPLVEGQ